jgi:hypothetical protein
VCLTFESLFCLIPGELIAVDDLARVQAHGEQVFCLLEQLASEHQDEVCPVSNLNHCERVRYMSSGREARPTKKAYLRLLLLASHNEDLRRRVDDFELAQNGSGIVGDKEAVQVLCS